jgi:hypothetical protein
LPFQDRDRAGAAVHPDQIAGQQPAAAVSGADDAWNAHLAGHDRAVTGGSTDVDDDRPGQCEKRRPAGIGEPAYQDLPGFRQIAVGRIVQDADTALNNAGTSAGADDDRSLAVTATCALSRCSVNRRTLATRLRLVSYMSRSLRMPGVRDPRTTKRWIIRCVLSAGRPFRPTAPHHSTNSSPTFTQ